MPSSEIKEFSESISCAKCHAQNKRSEYYCQSCGSHLYIHCGKRNARSTEKCVACGRRIRDAFSFQRAFNHLFTYRTMKSIPMQIILGVLVAIIVFRLALMVVGHF